MIRMFERVSGVIAMGYHVAVCVFVVVGGFLARKREIVYNVGIAKGCKMKYVAKPIRKWKYEDDERDMGDMGVECYDCGLDYDEGCGWCDIGVPHEVWELINPTNHRGSGLLCFNCMARRLAFIGLKDVPIFIGSGPFETRDPTEKERKMYFPPAYRRERLT